MTDAPEAPASKPKTIVTEEALRVNPAVLGLPLARPWRRLVAIGIDGLLCAILAAGASVLLGVAAALVLFRASARKPSGGYFKRSVRFAMRSGAALALFIGVMGIYNSARDRIARLREGEAAPGVMVQAGAAGSEDGELELEGMEAVSFATHVVALHRADDEESAREAARELLDEVHQAGQEGGVARATLRDLAGEMDEDRAWITTAVGAVLAEDEAREARENPDAAVAAAAARIHADSLTAAYTAARATNDSLAADSIRPALVRALSADTVRALDERYDALDERRVALAGRIETLEAELEEGPGILSVVTRFVNDLGLGLGWFGLYFTAATALWQGRTPGKRLLGIRVISLTGKPIGWWASFERFGGYAAGFATGLLGFAQVLWDDNRQAIHDKIAVTAVIRDPPRGRAAAERPEA